MDVYECRRVRLIELLAEVPAAELWRRSGIAAATISRYKSSPESDGHKRMTEDNARRIEAAGRKPPGWLDRKPSGAAPAPVSAGGALSIAQVMSQQKQRMTPITITWESLLTSHLMERFSLVIRDEAMAPQFKPGHTVEFDSTRQAKPGDVVLLVDADGNAYIRDYVERRPGLWTAAPRSSAYQPLESATDGLRVLAVLVGHTWG